MPKVSSYTVRKKLEVVEWHEDHGRNVSATSRHFGIDRKRIREWCLKRPELLQHNYGKESFKRKLSNGRPVLSEELDDSLFEFFEKERRDGFAVSNRMLAEEAINIAKKLNLNDFKGSSHFLKRWKHRFNVTMRQGTSESQKLPEDYADAVLAFFQAIRASRELNSYTDYNIANMDETMVRFDSVATRTNNIVGESTIRIVNTGCKKRGFTVALSARASGHKLPAFMIFKEPTGRIPPKVMAALKIPKNVVVTCTVNGWMTTEKMSLWINSIWKGNEDDVRRLIILDQAPVHKTPKVMQDISSVDTDVIFIPAGCTSLVQPADISWNKPFKDHLRSAWVEFVQKRKKTAKGNLQKPSRQDMINFVSFAWEALTEAIVEKSFKCCGISVSMDGSENGLFHSRLAEVNRNATTDDDMNSECIGILFDSDSEDSFDGFSDDD